MVGTVSTQAYKYSLVAYVELLLIFHSRKIINAFKRKQTIKMLKAGKIFSNLRLANLKKLYFYVYQAHFSADKQLVSCTQIDIFDFRITVGSRLSERIGTEGCSDNRNVRIIEVLTNSIDNTCMKT